MRKVLRRHASNPIEGELYIRKWEWHVKKNTPPQSNASLTERDDVSFPVVPPPSEMPVGYAVEVVNRIKMNHKDKIALDVEEFIKKCHSMGLPGT